MYGQYKDNNNLSLSLSLSDPYRKGEPKIRNKKAFKKRLRLTTPVNIGTDHI
jgi:hypothetical protein